MKRSRLKSDPAKTAEWQRRSRQPLNPGKRKVKAKIPQSVRDAARRRNGGICVRPGCDRKAIQLHHVLDESLWPELAKVEANLVGVCPLCNYRHHFEPDGRLPKSALPPSTMRLVARLGPKAQMHIDRFYVD